MAGEQLHYTRKLPDLLPVSPGATASVRVPRGPTYRGILLKYLRGAGPVAATEAQMKAELTEISLKINGITRWSASATRVIDLLTKYYGQPFADGLLYIPLARHYLDNRIAADNTAWGTRNVQTLTMEVKIDSAAVTPDLTAFAVVDPVARDLGAIVEVHETPFDAGGAGILEISTLVQSRGQLAAMHLANANITGAEVAVNQVDFQNVDIDVLEFLYKHKPSERVPQAGYRHIEPAFLNRLSDVWPMRAEDWRLKLDLSAGGQVGVVMETFNQPLGPAAAA